MSVTSREVAIATVPKVTGALSMAGSGWITYEVLSDPHKRHKTYHRLVVLLSICDIISSFSYFLSTWPIPQGENVGWKSPYHYQAVGNAATCTAQGFGIQFGVTTAFFNIMLAIHYLLVIKFNYTESALKKKEPFLWGTALVVGLGLSVPGLVLQIYNNSNLWCWISPNWDLCEERGLARDQCVGRTYNYRWAFYYGPLWTCISLITLAQAWLWWTVRQMEVRASKWRSTDSRAIRMRQSRRVAVQAAWYMVVFVVTWLPYTAIAMTGKYFNPHDVKGFVVLLFVVTCQPIQGCLNLFVYHRRSIAGATSRAASKLAKSAAGGTSRIGKSKHQKTLANLREELKDNHLTTIAPEETTARDETGVDMEVSSESFAGEEEAHSHNEDPEDSSTTHFENEIEPTTNSEESLENLHDIYD